MRYRITRSGSEYVGALEVACGDAGCVTARGVGATKADALANAALLAERLAQDPVLAALLPPGTLAAIRTAKALSAAALKGPRTVRRLWSRFKSARKRGRGLWSRFKSARKLATALHAEAVGAAQPKSKFLRKLMAKAQRKRARRMPARRPPPPPPPPPEPEYDEPDDPDDGYDDDGGDE